jgi:hypothetical protein
MLRGRRWKAGKLKSCPRGKEIDAGLLNFGNSLVGILAFTRA